MGEVAGSIPARSTIQLEEQAQRNLWVRRKGCSSTEQILGPMPVSGRLERLLPWVPARVAKSADAGDLKSPVPCGRAGSSPVPGTLFIVLLAC